MYYGQSETLKENWRILFDPEGNGKELCYPEKGIPAGEGKDAVVPGFAHQCYYYEHGIFWYETRFQTKLIPGNGKRLFLRVGAADFLTDVWLNGTYLGNHRGPEDPFSFDVTDSVITTGENILVFRISKPYEKDIDGYRFGEIPHRNQRPSDIWPGTCYNECGISGEATLVLLPEKRIDDLYLTADPKTGVICAEYTVVSDEDTVLTLVTKAGNKRTGEVETGNEIDFAVKKGYNRVTVGVPVSDVRLWSTDDPFLYFVHAAVFTKDGTLCHELFRHTGFRTFRVNENGWFELNGKRVFLRCSHTGNCFPYSTHAIVPDPSFVRKDLDMAKSSGLNMIRFISGAALPDQLDYCDEIGLMVYEEPVASWLTEDGPRSKEFYEDDLFSMVLRDRSHPSICIWGMLNETNPTPPFGDCSKWGREALPGLRELDKSRLVLYSSGRFDGDLFTGSVSNPGSEKWECLWNKENENDPTHVTWQPGDPGALFRGVGDIHAYPRNPVSKYDKNLLRTVGCDAKRPVFLSENGCGSLFDVVWLAKKFEEQGVSKDLPDVRQVYNMRRLFLEDLKKYGFEDEFAFPGDILRKSQEMHCRQRGLAFDLVRSNPYMCGYSITGLLDHSICGEGLWTLMREWKPGIVDAMQNGLAPLKWCFFLEDSHVYSGKPVRLEVVLANEDVLKEKEYPVCLRVTGENGVVWEKKLTLLPTAEQLATFSVPVFDGEVTFDLPTGIYELHADMEGAAAFDSSLTFFVTDDSDIVAEVSSAAVWGLNGSAAALLEKKGVKTVPFAEIPEDKPALIVLGAGPDAEKKDIFAKAYRMAENGSRVFVASRLALIGESGWSHYLPFEDKPENYPSHTGFVDWLYHKEYLARRNHPYFKGLPRGMMDWEYYIYLINGADFRFGKVPDEIASASFGPGNINDRGYEGGFNIGSYRMGKGALILNSYNLVENIGLNPAADRLFINILNEECRRLG